MDSVRERYDSIYGFYIFRDGDGFKFSADEKDIYEKDRGYPSGPWSFSD